MKCNFTKFVQDTNQTWYTDTPSLSLCFINTILIWVPCCVFWTLLPFEIRRIRQKCPDCNLKLHSLFICRVVNDFRLQLYNLQRQLQSCNGIYFKAALVVFVSVIFVRLIRYVIFYENRVSETIIVSYVILLITVVSY